MLSRKTKDNLIIAMMWIGGIGLTLFGIYYAADNNLFPSGCGINTPTSDPCQIWGREEECAAKILVKGLQENRIDESKWVSFPDNVKSTKQSATIKLTDTQFVIVEYQSACNVIFESAKLAKLEQP